jgi:hypothetical protein
MHGNRANVILFQNDSAIALFRSHLKSDLTLTLSTLNRTLDFSEQTFREQLSTLAAYYFTFGKLVWQYWNDKIKGFRYRFMASIPATNSGIRIAQVLPD